MRHQLEQASQVSNREKLHEAVTEMIKTAAVKAHCW
jgi:hypothetical protein